MSLIIPTLSNIVKEILSNGVSIGKTKESQNIRFTWELSQTNWAHEKAAVALFYQQHGLSLADKIREEEYHYQFLKYSLLQKIRATKYFHNQGLESRKLVIFSEDCISLLQWFSRPELQTNYLNVYIRSSDALGLLGCDLLYVQEVANAVRTEHPEVADFETVMDVQIASCHIYICPETGKAQTRDGVETTLACQ